MEEQEGEQAEEEVKEGGEEREDPNLSTFRLAIPMDSKDQKTVLSTIQQMYGENFVDALSYSGVVPGHPSNHNGRGIFPVTWKSGKGDPDDQVPHPSSLGHGRTSCESMASSLPLCS